MQNSQIPKIWIWMVIAGKQFFSYLCICHPAQTFPDHYWTWDFHLQKEASGPRKTFLRLWHKAAKSLKSAYVYVYYVAWDAKTKAIYHRSLMYEQVNCRLCFFINALPWLTAQFVPLPTAASQGRRLPHCGRNVCPRPRLRLLTPGSCQDRFSITVLAKNNRRSRVTLLQYYSLNSQGPRDIVENLWLLIVLFLWARSNYTRRTLLYLTCYDFFIFQNL